MYPRFAHPKTVFGVKYREITIAGAIEGRIKCLTNLRPVIGGVPRSIDALSPVGPHAFMPYISAPRPLSFNAVFIHNDLPDARLNCGGSGSPAGKPPAPACSSLPARNAVVINESTFRS
jgi:hypothetical protein